MDCRKLGSISDLLHTRCQQHPPSPLVITNHVFWTLTNSYWCRMGVEDHPRLRTTGLKHSQIPHM